jgi:hypothetical protein
MRRLVWTLLVLLGVAPALATPQWMTLPATPALPRPARTGFAPVNGIRIWYAEFGSGEPVVLLHGRAGQFELLGQSGSAPVGASRSDRDG